MSQNLEIIEEFEHDFNLDVVEKLPVKERTKTAILGCGKSYLRYLSSENRSFNEESIITFLNLKEQDGNELAPATRNNRKSLLKRIVLAQPLFQQDLLKRAMLEESLKRVKSFQVDNKVSEDKYLTYPELQKLWGSCKGGSKRKYKTGLIIKALFQSGCRVSELINIRLDSCTPNGHTAIEVIGKGNKVRTVFIETELYEEIKNVFGGVKWLFESESGGRLFRNNVLVAIKRVGRNAGIKKVIGCHTMRHSCLMFLKLSKENGGKGLNLREISSYAGHSSSSITIDFYDHSMPTASKVLD
jgi:integrase